MVRDKLTMELIADKKSRFRTFRNREKGLKKKLDELSTVKACMMVNGPDGDGPSSSQSEFWPENPSEVECIIEKYMKEVGRLGKEGIEFIGCSWFLVLEIRKKTAALEPQKLQEEIANTKGRTLEGGVDEFSYAELMAIIGKLCKKLEEVENIIDFKKGETNSMDEPTVHWSHMQGLSAIQPLDIHVPMQGIFLEYDLGFLDQGTGEVEYGLGFSDKGTGTVEYANGLQGKLGKPAYLEDWITTITSLTAGESAFKVTFDWDEQIGEPGAFIIRNNHHSEFYLRTLTLEDVPGCGRIHFVCNSWVYPAEHYKTDRVFFTNQTYIPSETPGPLRKYREGELVSLRGDGTGELKEWDRVYDYAYYNDLGNPDRDLKYARPVLGGSAEYPYPRRGRIGRPPSEKDPNTESRLPLLMSLNIYVPRDERFGHLKMSDFLACALKSVVQFLLPEFEALCDSTPNEFDSFQDVLDLYEGGIKVPEGPLLDKIKDNIPLEMLKELVRTDGEHLFKFPMPQVIKEDKSAWRTDEEFAREMLAGLNPVVIRLLQEFPPKSKLDPEVYGNQNSSITKEHIENHLDGLTINKAMKKKRLFILDHHDVFMPYLRRINTTSTKTYASRTLLFLKDDGTLKPLAIELSLPHPNGDKFGAVNKVYTPAEDGVEGSIWQLAKAYASVNDSGYHQVLSHWLNTHAAIEPFVIATNRQLSVLHPIHKLLHPHFRDTMNINALARQILINAGGVVESTVFPSKYAMEMSSLVYKDWVFTEQALPADLIKRGMAVEDSEVPHGLRLLIDDYPYAVDGLEIWSAIETWVKEYCSFYYKTDEMVQKDSELQSWWKELREEGHGDKKDEPWWPKMHTVKDLIETCTIIIWVASALHAAVNFGQYPYAGYLPNRPTISRRFMPEEGTPEYEELKSNPDKAFLKTITAQLQTLLGISLIEILSRHSSDEVYLGQRDTPEWTLDTTPLKAFEKFGRKLADIEEMIIERNGDERFKNRVGPVKIPYTLLYPTSKGGLTGKGIPNSVSI